TRSMDKPLSVGVLGLGPLWRRRYKPALLAQPRRFAVRAVCDPIVYRAALEARQVGAEVFAGPTEMLERAAVEALLLLDTPWYGLWPLELACRFGRPVFCAGGLEQDEAHADDVL